MTGPGSPGSIARLLTKTGDQSRPALRSGQVVRAQVLKQIAPSKWMLGIGGRVIAASSERSLGVGSKFMAQVRVQSGTILLQPYEQVGGREGAMRFLASEGLPQDNLSHTIVRAMLRTGVSLDPSRIQNLYAFFNSRDDVSTRLVRTYLLMQEKGMEPSSEGLERLINAVEGSPEREGEGDRHGSGRESYRRGGSQKRRDSEPKDPEDTLEEVVTRRDQEPTHFLQAFNHLTSQSGHWMVVPFSLADEDRVYEGSLRIHFSMTGEKPFFDRAVATVGGTPEQGWSLEIVRPPTGDGRRARLFYPQGNEPPEHLLGELRERLSALGLGAGPIDLREATDFDGFSTEDGPDILKGIDTEA